MDTNVKLCMGCMNELDSDGTCHYCNYTDDIPFLQSYLAPRTVLDNRYIVGKMLSYNGEGASYICYDMVGKTKAVVREYMPDVLCERENGTQKLIVNQDCLAKYKTYMSEFADMNKVLSRMKSLSHISTAMDMFVQNNTTYVVLEYVEGVSLKKFLQSNTGYLSWNQVKKLFVPIFTTLSIIHNAGIIHRGISPDNIIVTTDGELKLTGFCISSIRTANTGLSTEFYSGYTAPEQYSSLEYQGTWTDVYAVSAVIYRILTGHTPQNASARVRYDSMSEAARLNPNVPMHISRVLTNALTVKGENRIQTINELVSDFFDKANHLEHQKGATQTIPIQKVIENRSLSKSKKSTGNKSSEKNQYEKKTNPTTLAFGVAILLVFVCLGIFLLYQLTSAPRSNDSENEQSKFISESVASYDNQQSDIGNTSSIPVLVTTEVPEDSPYGTGSIMPNLFGMRYETVVEQLGEDFAIRADYFYSDSEEKGIITEQNIPEGSEYSPEKKNELVLKVCRGSENVPVPDYVGQSEKDYCAILSSLDIKYKIERVSTGQVTIGYVVSTSIDIGYNINVKNAEVLTVKVSKGVEQTTAAKTEESTPSDENQSTDDSVGNTES